MTNQKQNSNDQTHRAQSIDEYIQSVMKLIQKEKIQLVFIGLGAPKQEYLMEALAHTFKGVPLSLRLRRSVGGSNPYYKDRHSRLNRDRDDKTIVFMSVGGAFDMLAGNVARAPKIVQTMGFEWLWRLFQEPWRWKRQTSLLTFFRMVLFQKN